MVASPNYGLFIYDGDGSGFGLERTGAEVAKTPAQAAMWGGTAGLAFDPCYHQACDDLDNLSLEALGLNADAIAYVTFLYATGAEVIDTTP